MAPEEEAGCNSELLWTPLPEIETRFVTHRARSVASISTALFQSISTAVDLKQTRYKDVIFQVTQDRL